VPAAGEQGLISSAKEGRAAPPDFVAVGAHVASVLAAAEQTASQIRQDANLEADAIREDALDEAVRVRDQAVSALRDAQRQQADIEKLVREVRGAADAYSEQRRREGDEAAAKAENRLRKLGRTARELADQVDQSLAHPESMSSETAEETVNGALTRSARKSASRTGNRPKGGRLTG
jgi:DNA anti-recombination protein RmuC